MSHSFSSSIKIASCNTPSRLKISSFFDFTKTLKQNIESTQIDHYKPHMANDMDLMQDVADMFLRVRSKRYRSYK